VNELLIQKRENLGFTRKQIAEITRISVSMVEKVEKGTRRASPDLARRWGKQLGIKESQLFKYFFDCQSDIMSDCADQQQATMLPRTG